MLRFEGLTGSDAFRRADRFYGGRLPGGLSPAEYQGSVGTNNGALRLGVTVVAVGVALWAVMR